jgi:4-hydroxybenzoate polyprenyltransferase
MDFVSITAVIISGILIFTTIQAQDFPDVEGDKALGRMTFPIYAPEFSRAFTLFATVTWSMFLSWFWGVGPVSAAFLVFFGTFVGLRYYHWRTLEADKKSYLIFNVRPQISHEAGKVEADRCWLFRSGSWPRTSSHCMSGHPFWPFD